MYLQPRPLAFYTRGTKRWPGLPKEVSWHIYDACLTHCNCLLDCATAVLTAVLTLLSPPSSFEVQNVKNYREGFTP